MQGSARERCIALETCGLVVLTLQDNHNEFMRSIRATILKFIQSPKSTHVQIKVCVIDGLTQKQFLMLWHLFFVFLIVCLFVVLCFRQLKYGRV